jgi:hypothetical protein
MPIRSTGCLGSFNVYPATFTRDMTHRYGPLDWHFQPPAGGQKNSFPRRMPLLYARQVIPR